MKKLLLLPLITLLACQENQRPACEQTSDQIAGLIVRRLDGYLAYDQPTGDLGMNGIKVSSADQYNRVFTICCATRLDSIDFTKFDVLGLSTVNRGSSSTYLQDVQRDDVNKKITYTVTERYCHRSSPVDGRGNFVIVPKLPADYSVEYVRNQ